MEPYLSIWSVDPRTTFERTVVVVAAGLVLILALTGWACTSGPMWLQFCRADIMPVAERVLGFQFGEVKLPGGEGVRRGFVRVEPDAAMARAGVRVGDIPIDHHGGEPAFCGSLRSAAAGGSFPFDVVYGPEWGRAPRREIIPPAFRLE